MEQVKDKEVSDDFIVVFRDELPRRSGRKRKQKDLTDGGDDHAAALHNNNNNTEKHD